MLVFQESTKMAEMDGKCDGLMTVIKEQGDLIRSLKLSCAPKEQVTDMLHLNMQVYNLYCTSGSACEGWCNIRGRLVFRIFRKNYRLFVPKTFRSQARIVPMGKIRSRELSLPGFFVPGNFRSPDLSFPGLFVPRNVPKINFLLDLSFSWYRPILWHKICD